MLILKAILTGIWFLLVPYLLGLYYTARMKEQKNSILLALLCGYAGMFALFEIMALPMIFARLPFSVLKYSFGIAAGGLALISLVVNRRRISQGVGSSFGQARKLTWTCLLAAVLILLQIGIYVVGMSLDLDDSFYVASAGTAIHTDTMFQYNAYTGVIEKLLPPRYVLSPFPIMLAFFGEAVQFHPTIVAHTVMPVFFLALVYSLYGLIGQKLFDGDVRATGMFLSFLSVIHIFSYYSVYNQGTFTLIRIWQGKALLAALLLPLVFYLGLRVFAPGQKATGGDWLALVSTMTACCLVSSMGAMLAPIMLGIMTLVMAVFKGAWKKTGLAVLCCVPCLLCGAIYLVIR